MSIVGYSIAGIVLLFLIAQFAVVFVSKRKRGHPPGSLRGPLATAVASGKPTMVYFFSPSCGVCRSVTPVIAAMRREEPNIHSVDVSRDSETAKAFGVMATPTVVTVNGGIIEEVIVGAKPEGDYRQAMSKFRKEPRSKKK
ncbi:MAG: thioredoxin family protein [Bacteroidota bacterium]